MKNLNLDWSFLSWESNSGPPETSISSLQSFTGVPYSELGTKRCENYTYEYETCSHFYFIYNVGWHVASLLALLACLRTLRGSVHVMVWHCGMKGTNLWLDLVGVPTFQQIIFETCPHNDEVLITILAVYSCSVSNMSVLIGDIAMECSSKG